MFGLTTRGQLDPATQLEFERLYARLTEFLSVSFDEEGALINAAPDTRVIGEVIHYAGVTIPDKWLLCDGTAYSRVTFKALYECIGTAYGAGDGSTTFNVPDCRGRNILSKATSGTYALSLGETGGSATHTHTFSGVSISGTTTANGGHGHSVSGSGNTSSDGSHSHSQGAHSHANVTVAAADDAPNVPGASVAGNVTQTDIFNDSGTGSAGTHSHNVSISGSTDNVGDHTHDFSASGSGSVTSSSNISPYITFNTLIYAGVSA